MLTTPIATGLIQGGMSETQHLVAKIKELVRVVEGAALLPGYQGIIPY